MHTYPRYAAPSQRAVVQLVRERPYAVRASALAGQAPVSSYDAMPAAPTLDYAAVHLTGDVELFEDRDGTHEVVEATFADGPHHHPDLVCWMDRLEAGR